MNKRIFTINQAEHKEAAWRKYLNNINAEANSLQYYLKYFNPDYHVFNDTLWGNEGPIPPSKNKTEFRHLLYIVNDIDYDQINDSTVAEDEILKKYEIYALYAAPILRFRQGFLNEDPYAYISFRPFNILKTLEGIKINQISFGGEKLSTFICKRSSFNQYLQQNIFADFPSSSVLFSIKWAHQGIQEPDNTVLWSKNNYIVIPKSAPAYYFILGQGNKMLFNYFEQTTASLGSNLFFAFDFFPIRYIPIAEEKGINYTTWFDETTSINFYAAYWERSNSEPQIFISDKIKTVWSGSYPLMSQLYIKNGNSREDFITDEVLTTAPTNIANHNTFFYNINIKDIKQDKVKWKNFISINII